jgi:hypothetical protein
LEDDPLIFEIFLDTHPVARVVCQRYQPARKRNSSLRQEVRVALFGMPYRVAGPQ